MKPRRILAAALLLAAPLSPRAWAFCGFYVAKADSKLFNKASQVVLVRDDGKTVLTMANDFKGDPKEFAIVIPVPTVLERDQINVAEKGLIDHLDAYSAPRLVEYFDPNPCERMRMRAMDMKAAPAGAPAALDAAERASVLGVKIEAQYTVGEYDILILSAKESGGLEQWLVENGYRIPQGASPVLQSYIGQNLKFFVAKVNLKEQAKAGFTYLRPLQVAYESPKFMLPIRLGTVNADGPQELFIYALTRNGRVETTNYRTVKLPSDQEIPEYVKDEFSPFYRAMFDVAVKKEDMRVVFLEYAWDMAWCDPCAADPLTNEELQDLGVFWVEDRPRPLPGAAPIPRPGLPRPPRRPVRPVPPQGAPQQVFLTRLHLRYDREHFPDDLAFQETSDRSNFQGRYILRHPWRGTDNCPEARAYREEVTKRAETQAQTLASLTGWDVNEIRRKMGLASGGPTEPTPGDDKWYRKLWRRQRDEAK